MQKLRPSFALSSTLLVLLTACGESTQFRVLPAGEAPISVLGSDSKTPSGKSNENPDDPAADLESEARPETYAGSEEVPGNSASTGSSPQQSVDSSPEVPKLFDDCGTSPDKNIVAELYELPSGTQKLPDFSSLASLGTVCVAQLNIKDREFSEGFPGVENLVEWFGLDMRFQVEVPKSGIYEFSLISDDGAILSIDDSMIIDNDGLHAVKEKKASVYLNKGAHSFHLAYYQGPRWRIALELYWKIPGTTARSYIPTSSISRP